MAADEQTWPATRTQWDQPHLPVSTNPQSDVNGGRHEQPGASRVAFLEAGIKEAQVHGAKLQGHVAFLQAQLSCYLGHISRLKTTVRDLESELTSLRASLTLRPNPGPTISKAVDSVAADSVVTNPVAASTTPPLSPASAPSQDVHRLSPGQHHEPSPPAPGLVGNYALWDLRPKGADGSGAAFTSSGQGAPSAPQTPKPAASRFPGAPYDVQGHPSADPAGTYTSSVLAEQAENSSSRSSATPTAVKASATSRHPLHDFWAGSNCDNSPQASNTRNRGLPGEPPAYLNETEK